MEGLERLDDVRSVRIGFAQRLIAHPDAVHDLRSANVLRPVLMNDMEHHGDDIDLLASAFGPVVPEVSSELLQCRLASDDGLGHTWRLLKGGDAEFICSTHLKDLSRGGFKNKSQEEEKN